MAKAIREIPSTKADIRVDEKGYTLIWELFADYLLKDYSKFDRENLQKPYITKIRNSFKPAVEYLEKHGIPVYIIKEPGKRNIECITIDPNYDGAKGRHLERAIYSLNEKIKAVKRNLEFTTPDLLEIKYNEIQTIAKKRTPKIALKQIKANSK